jgi:hypothetical protein
LASQRTFWSHTDNSGTFFSLSALIDKKGIFFDIVFIGNRLNCVFLSTPCKDLTFWDFWWVQFIWWKTVMLRSGKPVFCVSMVCVYVHGISNGVSPAVCDFVLFFLYYTHWHSVFPSEFSTKWWFLNGFWVFHVGFWLFNIYVNCLFLCPNLCFFFFICFCVNSNQISYLFCSWRDMEVDHKI